MEKSNHKRTDSELMDSLAGNEREHSDTLTVPLASVYSEIQEVHLEVLERDNQLPLRNFASLLQWQEVPVEWL